MPKLFGVEWAARVGILHELIANSPSTVAAFDQVHPSRLVSAVGIVIAGKQIAILIENEILRIAQTEGEYFEAGTVGVAPKDAAGVRLPDRAAIGKFHV